MTKTKVKDCSEHEVKQHKGVVYQFENSDMPKTQMHNGTLYRNDGSVYLRCVMRPLDK